ncbi:MAG: HAMP domain-containing histidine kinase [Acidobacteria bacterium]|nr:HAMP domain-containing histidine kinase [Acidobacteriota bacterium]
MRRPSWQLAAAAVLLVLLAVLGTLQYRWLGEVSTAERDRLHEGLRTRASEFSRDFDREVTRTYLAFHFDSEAFGRDPAAVMSEAFARARKESTVGGIVRSAYLYEATGVGTGVLQRLDPAARTLSPAEWPDAFRALRARAEHSHVIVSGPGLLPAPLGSDAVEASVPALIVPVAFIRRVESGSNIAILPDPAAARSIILWLDADRLRQQLLPSLVARHFGPGPSSEYVVRIVGRDDPSQVIYESAARPIVTPQSADVSTGVFDLKLDEVSRLAAGIALAGVPGKLPLPPDTPLIKNRFAITIYRRAGNGDGQRALMAGADEGGAWRVLIGFKAGPLDALVAASRRRNLAISLGVLGLLAGSFVLVIASAERQQRLARQQMEFVASVSHELRTPLAVICSAGENLADGVVGESEQIKRYGRLVETEGRRLGDMVERVLEFAGISAGTAVRVSADVDVSKVIAEAVSAVSADARDRGVTVTLHPNGTLPPVTGDADALRSAVQNIVGNAVKYSPNGGPVDVSAHVQDERVRIRVADRGLGIDASDLPHIFKPFYRGRRAVDAQIRGTGVGLSVVHHIVEAHRGRIAVDSKVGEGTTVVVELPAAEERSVKSEG